MAETPTPAPQTGARSPREQLAASASTVQSGVAVVAGLATIAGAIMIIVGKVEDGGGYLDSAVVYDLRGPGFIVVTLALLLGPISWLVAKAVEVWAGEQ